MPATPKHAMTTRKQEKARRDRLEAKARKACVEAVWKRAGGCCEVCGVPLSRPANAPSFIGTGHVHERLSRAKGGSPHDPANCVLLCVRDHGQAHGLRFGSTV